MRDKSIENDIRNDFTSSSNEEVIEIGRKYYNLTDSSLTREEVINEIVKQELINYYK